MRVSKEKIFKQTALDRVVSYFDPQKGLLRMEARARMTMAAGGYKSGDRDRREFRNWALSSGSADAETLPYLENLRSDSRDLMRNAPLARGAINTVVTNVVGTGLYAESQPDKETLRDLAGLSDGQIEKFVSAAEREFRLWASKRNCDASRKQNFTGLQRLILRSMLESGDVFTLRRMISRPNSRIKLALQVIEADRVANPNRASDNNQIAGGVERDALGAPIAYHVLKKHPGERFDATQRETERIAAYFSTGDWQVLHHFIQERPEQTRGVPYLAPVVESLKQLTRYTEAEIMSAVVSSMFTAFIKTDDGGGLEIETQGSPTPGQDETRLGPGAIVDLARGEDIIFANPGRPNAAFDPFVLSILRQVGVALEIPFEILVKHFTASYSAAQAALLEAWKFFKTMRVWMADNFCQPCYEAVITEAVAKGTISAPGFFADPLIRDAYLQTDWIGPPRGMIDMNKEANANKIMQDEGWKTGSEITAEMTGGDWNRKHERLSYERKKRLESGLIEPFPAQAAGSAETDQKDQQDNGDQESKDVG